MFPTVAEGFDQLLALVEKTVGLYNGAVAGEIERVERLLIETAYDDRPSPLTIDLTGLIEHAGRPAKGQVAFMVDMAKADALDLLGETRQAFELVDRQV